MFLHELVVLLQKHKQVLAVVNHILSIPGILRTMPVAHPAIPAFISESKEHTFDHISIFRTFSPKFQSHNTHSLGILFKNLYPTKIIFTHVCKHTHAHTCVYHVQVDITLNSQAKGVSHHNEYK